MTNAQAGKYDLDGLLALSNIDIDFLSEIGADITLTPEEKQLVAVLRDYEKKANERHNQQGNKSIEGDRSESKLIVNL